MATASDYAEHHSYDGDSDLGPLMPAEVAAAVERAESLKAARKLHRFCSSQGCEVTGGYCFMQHRHPDAVR